MKLPEWVSNKEKLEFNDEFSKAYDLLENSDKHVFVTGKAGTGKSTLLRYFRANTLKNVAVLAPTGVAAINVEGQTIHSFFGFKPDITPEKAKAIRVSPQKQRIYRNLDMIVVDEISMVRADLLDCVDSFLRIYGPDESRRFGGVQMVFFGDLYQLPPIVSYSERDVFSQYYRSPYFFNAHVMEDLAKDEFSGFAFVELNKVYRQTDEDFIHILNAIRNNSVDQDQLDTLNARHIPDFVPDSDEFFIYLTTTNQMASEINKSHLKHLKADEAEFEGDRTGEFDVKNLPTEEILDLKVGAQVMLLNNDPMGRWINGSIGKVLSFFGDESNAAVRIELAGGKIVNVKPFTWEMFKFFYDEKSGMLKSESVGSFTQFPLKLAWAVTIHKSQGKTFDRVVVDTGRGTFAHGQMYVALTRCTSLEGLVLKKPITKREIIVDRYIQKFSEISEYFRSGAQYS